MSAESFFAGLDDAATQLQAGLVNRNKIIASETANKANLIGAQIKQIDEMLMKTIRDSMGYGEINWIQDPDARQRLTDQKNLLQERLNKLYGLDTHEIGDAETQAIIAEAEAGAGVGDSDVVTEEEDTSIDEITKQLNDSQHGLNIVDLVVKGYGDKWAEVKINEFGEFSTATDKEVVANMLNRGLKDLRKRREDAPPFSDILKGTWDSIKTVLPMIIGGLPLYGAASAYAPQSQEITTDTVTISQQAPDLTADSLASVVDTDKVGVLGTDKGFLSLSQLRDSPEFKSLSREDQIISALESTRGNTLPFWEKIAIRNFGKYSRNKVDDFFIGADLAGAADLSPFNVSPEGRMGRIMNTLAAVVKDGESKGFGYNAVANRGADPQLVSMTIGDIHAKYGDTATGAYQFKYSTIKDVFGRGAGLTDEQIDSIPYDMKTQDSLFRWALILLGIGDFLAGDLSEADFNKKIMSMFRGVGVDVSTLGSQSDDKGNIVRSIIPNLGDI